jgi:hypothetical protein
MKNKTIKPIKLLRAQVHLEIILSFVIFAGFVFFLLLFINPINQQKVSSSMLDKTWNNIQKNVSIDYQSISLIITPSGYDKIKYQNCFSVDLSSLNTNLNNILVLNSSQTYISSIPDSGGTNLQISNIQNESFFTLYISNSLNPHHQVLGSCTNLILNTDYYLGLIDNQNSPLYENLISLNKSYIENYSGLIDSLAIDNNFDFIFYNESRVILFNATNPNLVKPGNVLSRETPLTFIDQNAKKTKLIFNLRVWA